MAVKPKAKPVEPVTSLDMMRQACDVYFADTSRRNGHLGQVAMLFRRLQPQIEAEQRRLDERERRINAARNAAAKAKKHASTDADA